jgi:hypothetical protein
VSSSKDTIIVNWIDTPFRPTWHKRESTTGNRLSNNHKEGLGFQESAMGHSVYGLNIPIFYIVKYSVGSLEEAPSNKMMMQFIGSQEETEEDFNTTTK